MSTTESAQLAKDQLAPQAIAKPEGDPKAAAGVAGGAARAAAAASRPKLTRSALLADQRASLEQLTAAGRRAERDAYEDAVNRKGFAAPLEAYLLLNSIPVGKAARRRMRKKGICVRRVGAPGGKW